MKRGITIVGFCFVILLGLKAHGQSFLYLRNNSWLGFKVDLLHKGSHTPNSGLYSLMSSKSDDWQAETQTFGTERTNAIVPLGDSAIYSLAISHLSDTIFLDFRLRQIGTGTDIAARLHGNGFNSGYFGDQNFHQEQVIIAGHKLELVIKADNDDSQMNQNFRFAIHEPDFYHIDSVDFSDKNVLNVMAYNIQMLPLGVVGMGQAADRADLLPARISPYQDVVVFEEAFDILPRLLNLIPAMEAEGFVYNSGILNDYLPFNGGVITFSRWPIETTAEYDFELCGPNSQDCLANKGIMYTRINKLGKKYHVFGTHFDAGSDSLDLEAKNLQYAEMRDFIAAQNIPSSEPVIFGGDFNTSPLNDHNLYNNLHDSLHPFVPVYGGFPNSTMRLDTGDIIDHIMLDARHLLPIDARVNIETFRSVDPILWSLSDFSDHRAAVGRFEFPDLEVIGGDMQLCPGDGMAFSSTANIPVTRQWYHNGSTLPIISPGFSIPSVANQDSGLYELEMRYNLTAGLANDVVNQLFYPNGPQTFNITARLYAGNIEIGPQFCPISASPELNVEFRLFPNPANDYLNIERSQIDGILHWKIYNLQGMEVLSGRSNSSLTQIELKDLSAGTYMLSIVNQRSKVYHGLFLIQN